MIGGSKVLLLSPSRPADRPDADLRAVVADLLSALWALPALEVAHEPVADLAEVTQAVRRHRPDLVFNACETLGGRSSDEPLVPLLLERLGVACTGSSAAALHRCLFKGRASSILRSAGVLVPRTYALDDVPASAYPVIVKPDGEDGSIGIDDRSVAGDEASLRAAVASLEAEGRPAIVQGYVAGREIAVALLGWPEPRVLSPGEIDYDDRVFEGRPRVLSYASKWDESSKDYAGTRSVAADLSPQLFASLSEAALRAAAALGMRDYGRLDFRVDADGRGFVIDANPNCDLSIDGGFMRAARRSGLSQADVVQAIVTSALARKEAAAPRKRAG